MNGSDVKNIVRTYSVSDEGTHDFFKPVVLLCVIFFGSIGLYLKAHNPPPVPLYEKSESIHRTRFIIEPKRPEPLPEKKEPVQPEIVKMEPEKIVEPLDLTNEPLLNQEKDEISKMPPQQEKKTKTRRVYGLKKVYSTGIGASGNAADAIIGKRGNTLDTEIDTITATEIDLKGVAVSVTGVTRMPRIKKAVKPSYTPEMLEKRIEGVVRSKVLVDVDGKVKQVIVLDDLGYGSKRMVAEAWFTSLFEPAFIGNEPVPTWIIVKIRFEML